MTHPGMAKPVSPGKREPSYSSNPSRWRNFYQWSLFKSREHEKGTLIKPKKEEGGFTFKGPSKDNSISYHNVKEYDQVIYTRLNVVMARITNYQNVVFTNLFAKQKCYSWYAKYNTICL